MDTAQFDRDLGALAGSLGDATRRGVYIAVRESPEPLTAGQIAEMFDIHPNVARHHLDRLATDEYLTVTRKRPSGRTGLERVAPRSATQPPTRRLSSTTPLNEWIC